MSINSKDVFVLISTLVIAGLLASIYWLVQSRPVITWDMVNVNYGSLQGDAHVLRIADRTVLLDAGYYEEAKQRLLPLIQNQGIKHIDYFIISHPHRDHYEGALALIEAGISIGFVLFKEPARKVNDCCYSRSHLVWFIGKLIASGTQVKKPKTGYQLPLPLGSSLEVLHAQEGNLPEHALDVNDLSMVIRWSVYGRTVLFTGDLNHTMGTYLSNDPRMRADILKIPHHGGRGIVPNSFYQQVDPLAALVPGPAWLWCGERGMQTRSWLQDKGIPTWVNGLDGTVRLSFSMTDVTFKPPKPSASCPEMDSVSFKPASFQRWPSVKEIRTLLIAGLRARWHAWVRE